VQILGRKRQKGEVMNDNTAAPTAEQITAAQEAQTQNPTNAVYAPDAEGFHFPMIEDEIARLQNQLTDVRERLSKLEGAPAAVPATAARRARRL
jgi:hypothetical protein